MDTAARATVPKSCCRVYHIWQNPLNIFNGHTFSTWGCLFAFENEMTQSFPAHLLVSKEVGRKKTKTSRCFSSSCTPNLINIMHMSSMRQRPETKTKILPLNILNRIMCRKSIQMCTCSQYCSARYLTEPTLQAECDVPVSGIPGTGNFQFFWWYRNK